VFDDHVHATLDLPALLAFIADKVRTALSDNGRKLLK
jgi:hypothetical protein